MQNREKLGNDLLKKIIVYTLMMKKRVDEGAFYSFLMETQWFKETIDLYCNKYYEKKYNEIMNGFFARKVVKQQNGKLVTTVKP